MPKSKDSDESELDFIIQEAHAPRAYSRYERVIPVKEYTYVLDRPIGDPELYADMIFQIRNCNERDVIQIHINGPGGQLGTGVAIINAIRNCPGSVVTVLEGEAYSMHALIFLTGHTMIVDDNCLLMLHSASGGAMGKTSEMFANVEATSRWANTLMRDVCSPFMTAEEIERMLDGKDYWFDSKQIGERLQLMVDGIQARQEALEALEAANAAQALIDAAPVKKPRKPRSSKATPAKTPAKQTRK